VTRQRGAGVAGGHSWVECCDVGRVGWDGDGEHAGGAGSGKPYDDDGLAVGTGEFDRLVGKPVRFRLARPYFPPSHDWAELAAAHRWT